MKQVVSRSLLATLLILGAYTPISSAQDLLSEEALFHRCYSHLAQLRPQRQDPLLAQVRAGSKSGLQACREIFDSALFLADNGSKIQDDNNTVAKAVLQNLHQLHRSWAREQGMFTPTDANTMLGTETWNEDSPMGAFITRALFSPAYNVDSILQGTDFLTPVRTNMSPAQTYRGVPSVNPDGSKNSDWRLGIAHPFAAQGELLGIKKVDIAPISMFPATRFTNLNNMPDFENIGVPPDLSRDLSNLNMPDLAAVQGGLSETDQFAMIIRGSLQINAPGSYTIFLNADDAATLNIDDARIITRTGPGEGSAVAFLDAGVHKLTVEYRQTTAGARLIMSWQGPASASKQVVPASAFSGLRADYFTQSARQPFRLTGNEGGGFIGNHNYLFTTYMVDDQFVPDGAVNTNRSWARAVIKDTLCREIPVVRDEDAQPFVIPTSTTPFRQYPACTRCHSTADRMASLLQGLKWNPLPTMNQMRPLPDLIGILDIYRSVPSLREAAGWSDQPDLSISKRAPAGHFYFRNYKGELVDNVVRSFEELATAIRAQDDYYACFAKRYYAYFTGINVELGDPGEPSYPTLNGPEAYHRAKVIEYGKRLKSSKSLSQLVFDILGSKEYRMSDYGISYQGQ